MFKKFTVIILMMAPLFSSYDDDLDPNRDVAFDRVFDEALSAIRAGTHPWCEEPTKVFDPGDLRFWSGDGVPKALEKNKGRAKKLQEKLKELAVDVKNINNAREKIEKELESVNLDFQTTECYLDRENAKAENAKAEKIDDYEKELEELEEQKHVLEKQLRVIRELQNVRETIRQLIEHLEIVKNPFEEEGSEKAAKKAAKRASKKAGRAAKKAAAGAPDFAAEEKLHASRTIDPC